MNGRLSSCFGTFSLVVVFTLLGCAALITVPQALSTLKPALPSTAMASTAEATVRPISTLQCTDGDCAKACLARLSSIQPGSASSEARPKVAGHGSNVLPAEVLVTYAVNGDDLGAPQYADQVPAGLSAMQHETDAQQKIWDYFAAIIPADQRTDLIYYILATDGKGGMLASVEHFSGPSDSWGLVVDPADVNKPRDLTLTLLHEFGHLLTLNSSQVTPDAAVLDNPDDLKVYAREAASCPQYFATGGCSLPTSYINQFFSQFWTKLYSQWTAVNAAKNDGNYLSLLTRFYRNHATQFITPYAATSPEEDMAESWSYFVLSPKPADDSIAHRKVLFFYNFPELVALRSQIISNICTYAASQ